MFELPVRPALPHLLPPVRFDHVNDVANLHAANLAEGQMFRKTRFVVLLRADLSISNARTVGSTLKLWCSMRGLQLRITYQVSVAKAERSEVFVCCKPLLGGSVSRASEAKPRAGAVRRRGCLGALQRDPNRLAPNETLPLGLTTVR